jgi:hypothetical protein
VDSELALAFFFEMSSNQGTKHKTFGYKMITNAVLSKKEASSLFLKEHGYGVNFH